MNKYSDYQFNKTTRDFIELNGYVNPTQIQREVIPYATKGRDVIGISATGTGKTAAFLIPILEKINPEVNEIQAVISAPTRELAIQLFYVCAEIKKVNNAIRVKLISGGTDRTKMSDELKNQPHIVIGTPGRMKDMFLKEQSLRLEKAKIFVVDEADMTLEFGFLEDIDEILSHMNKVQMMSFSATVPMRLEQFLKKYMVSPMVVRIEEDKHFKPQIRHILVPCKHFSYQEQLIHVLKGINPYVCLIFANTREEVAKTALYLRENGYDCLELHGDLSPRQRKNALKSLQDLKQKYVVASDVASRGIDIEGISHVISLGFPKELDFYIHRSGRTGRAGKDGICYALYKKEDEFAIQQLIKKGTSFEHQSCNNGNFKVLSPIFKKKTKKDDPLEKEIAKKLHRKNQKVKPGYKKKRKEQIDRMKRKARREMIQKEIKQQTKERAIRKQRALRDGE